jgi:acetyl esterase/lipase
MAMQNFRTRLSNSGYGLAMKVLFNRLWSPPAMRRNFALFAATPRKRIHRRFPQVRFSDVRIGNLHAESVTAVPDPRRVLLYLHGGGYVFGSIETYRRRAVKLSYLCRAEVVMPDYRLAPEHPFPAALIDARSTWRHLAGRDDPRPVLIAGDSAGGGLALSLMVMLRDERERMPAGAVLLSPWTDLAMTGISVTGNRRKDCWFTREQAIEWASWYRGTESATDPLISPLHADLAGLPHLLLLAGDQEILLDDTRRLAVSARRAGVDVTEEIGAGMQHDWPLTLPWLPESRHAWRTIARFVDAVPARRRACDRPAADPPLPAASAA